MLQPNLRSQICSNSVGFHASTQPTFCSNSYLNDEVRSFRFGELVVNTKFGYTSS